MLFSRRSLSLGLLWKLSLLGLFLAIFSASLFWVAACKPVWIRKIVGWRVMEVLHCHAAQALLQIPMIDADGGGCPDWLETLRGAPVAEFTAGNALGGNLIVYQGARTRVRARLGTLSGGAWPIGFRALVAADRPILFLPGESAPTTGPIEVPASRVGTLDFDILVPDGDPQIVVNILNAANGRSVPLAEDHIMIDVRTPWLPRSNITCAGRPLPAIACRDVDFTPDGLLATCNWDRVPGATHYVVEIASTSRPEEWIPLEIHSDESAFMSFKSYTRIFLGRHPRIRVVPVIRSSSEGL